MSTYQDGWPHWGGNVADKSYGSGSFFKILSNRSSWLDTVAW